MGGFLFLCVYVVYRCEIFWSIFVMKSSFRSTRNIFILYVIFCIVNNVECVFV